MHKQPLTRIVRKPASELRLHPLAQRDIVPAKLKKLMAELDLDAIGVLHAVAYQIDGEEGPWIIDGQHRWRALMDHGLGEWVVDVKLHLGITDHAGASALFLKLNDRSPVSPYDKFLNEVRAEFPAAVSIYNLLGSRGLRFARNSADGQVCCPAALKKVYGMDSGKALGLALDTILAAWGKTAAAMEGAILEGIGLVYGAYHDRVERPALVNRLAKYSGGPGKLIGDAKGLKNFRKAPLPRCVAEVVIGQYNVGRRVGRLDPL
jgi:hypothetical protein